MTSTTAPTSRPGTTAQPIGSPRASWIRRFAAGAGAAMVLGGLSLTLAAPAQAAQTGSTLAAPAQAAQVSSTHLGWVFPHGGDPLCKAPWQPGVDYGGCASYYIKG